MASAPAERLREIGEALYGARWQSAVAADLRVSRRSIRRWLSGERTLQDGVMQDLERLLEERASKIEGMMR